MTAKEYTTMPMTLRPYQRDVVDALSRAWRSGMQRPAAIAATGAGKTVMFAHMIGVWSVAHPGARAVVLVHREELAEQTVDKLRRVTPDLSTGVVKAERDETDATVVVASVQTLMRPGRAERIKDVGLVVVDECHHYAADAWRRVMERLGCFRDDGPLVAGFTATMVRSDTRKLSTVWQDAVANVDILTLIKAGHLCDVRARAIEIDGLDLASVARRGGDFADGSLSDALAESNADQGIVKAYVEHGENRQAILFAPSVRFATACARAFDAADIPAAVISAATPSPERSAIYAAYRAGHIRILANCGVLTEGFDMPQASCLLMARPTQAPGLYIQMVGRVLRTFPGKEDALVLDVVGVGENLGLVGLVDLSPEAVRPEDGESLGEALDRVQKLARRRGGHIPLEHMTARQVDLFDRSSGAWKQTHRGVWFLSTKEYTYVLWPYGDTFRVLSYNNRGSKRTVVVGVDLTMSSAMGLAEREAAADEGASSFSVASRSAPWRKRAPSAAMLGFAARLEIDVDSDMRAGRVSDLIDVELASRYIDPRIKVS
jgi:superfamily II DNA or RNA helicase